MAPQSTETLLNILTSSETALLSILQTASQTTVDIANLGQKTKRLGTSTEVKETVQRLKGNGKTYFDLVEEVRGALAPLSGYVTTYEDRGGSGFREKSDLDNNTADDDDVEDDVARNVYVEWEEARLRRVKKELVAMGEGGIDRLEEEGSSETSSSTSLKAWPTSKRKR